MSELVIYQRVGLKYPCGFFIYYGGMESAGWLAEKMRSELETILEAQKSPLLLRGLVLQ